MFRGRAIQRPESLAVHHGKVIHRLWHETGNTLHTRDGVFVAFASPSVDAVRDLIMDLWGSSGVTDPESLLARSTVQYSTSGRGSPSICTAVHLSFSYAFYSSSHPCMKSLSKRDTATLAI